jgi:signal peptidase II
MSGAPEQGAAAAAMPPVRESGWRLLPLAALVAVADQASKGWIEANYVLGQSTPVLPVLDIVRFHNPGAAFSFLAGAGGWQRWFFIVLALGVSVVLVWWLRGVHAARERRLAVALSLILAGAIGNVIDRIEHGFVVDFIHAHWGGAYFPAFNIADAALTMGAGLMILDAFFEWRRERARGAAAGGGDSAA